MIRREHARMLLREGLEGQVAGMRRMYRLQGDMRGALMVEQRVVEIEEYEWRQHRLVQVLAVDKKLNPFQQHRPALPAADAQRCGGALAAGTLQGFQGMQHHA